MNVLVIGNGFDLDLGLHTTYRDFAESSYWDELYKSENRWRKNGLADFIKCQSREKEWFDIEECLAKYVKEKEKKSLFSLVDQDKHFHQLLERQLSKYLDQELLNAKLNEQSLANRIIRLNEDNSCFDSLYSFNLTEYDFLGAVDGSEMGYLYDVVNLHVSSKQMILGIGEDDCKSRDYSFLKKVCHAKIPQTNIILDLQKADIVVVFGHSLNRIDFKYFESYFYRIQERAKLGENSFVYIITKDENSIKSIKDNLCEHQVSLIELSSALTFISTDNYYCGMREEKEKVELLLKALIKEK